MNQEAVSPSIARQELVVSASGRGEFLTIGQALLAARTGALIRVEPGVYREMVMLDKPVEIAGVGPVEDIVVADEPDVILAQAADIMADGVAARASRSAPEMAQQNSTASNTARP